ncbi:xylosidase arabinosidase [Moniliophthora roreri MCA 2997]|uniref:Xylosidase arabinosidase n=2 Tax=Moniliophthora roreri TaxID=221103 RepID=V2XSA9_MONRO|nr:xylosidase arabinosidase [Moniliophthora roreri MCA 2997]
MDPPLPSGPLVLVLLPPLIISPLLTPSNLAEAGIIELESWLWTTIALGPASPRRIRTELILLRLTTSFWLAIKDGDGIPITDNGWSHWFKGNNDRQPTTDLWPDVSQYPPSELFPVKTLMLKSGEHPRLFSSRSPGTVYRHFHWMAENGVDGAFLQRPLRHCIPTADGELLHWRDSIGRLVREAAELERRVFAVMYDVSGVDPSIVWGTLQDDWDHLIQDEHVLDSPNYLREDGRAVVCLWGFGFASTNHDPDTVRAVVSHIRRTIPGGAYIIAGVPSHWRTSNGDADPSPEFLDLWLNEFDAISPWTVGCYSNNAEADEYATLRLREDLRLLHDRERVGKWRHVDYIPVVFPGCSGYNTSGGGCGFNSIKRNGGSFLWRQIYNACNAGVSVLYGASWDEYDEGTALMPAVAKKELLPVSHRYPLMSLDEDGYDIPSDWYMRICGLAKDVLCGVVPNGPTFPPQGLLNYWETRSRVDSLPSSHRVQSPTLSLDLEQEQSPPPYPENTSNPLSRYSTALLLQELQSRQPRLLPPISPASRPLPAIPVSARSEPGSSGEHFRHCHSTNPYGSVQTSNAYHNSGTVFQSEARSQSSAEVAGPTVNNDRQIIQFTAEVSMADVASENLTFGPRNITLSERRHTRLNDIVPAGDVSRATPQPNRPHSTLISKYEDLEYPSSLYRSFNTEASASSTSPPSPSSLFTRRRVSASLNPRPSIAVPEISPSTLADVYNTPDSGSLTFSSVPSSPTIFPPTSPEESDVTAVSGPSTPGSVNSRRLESFRCIVRRLKPTRSEASIPPVPPLPQQDKVEDVISLESSPSKDSINTKSTAKQRREELAKELKRRQKEMEAQKVKISAKRRPRRDPTVSLFGIPDAGFTM